MSFRLLRMILIDSYSPGRIAEFRLDGHINLNGENGAGKTTLLRLLPIFFGERPAKLLQGDATSQKFGKYYFPTQASYVVFEYQRRDKKVMAVLHTEGSSDKIVYRFIESEYKSEIFRTESGMVQSGSLNRHISRLNITSTPGLNREEYKSILQNTASRDNKINSARYSFCSNSGKIKNIEKIVTSVFEKETTFYDLKRMVVSSIRDDESEISLSASKVKLTDWLNDYNAHQLAASKQDLMAKLEDADRSRKETELLFEKLHARFVLLQEKVAIDLVKAQDEVKLLRNRMNVKNYEYIEKNSVLNGQKNEWSSQAKEEKNWLGIAKSKYAAYQEDHIEQKVAQVDALIMLKDQLRDEQLHLEKLTSKQQSVMETFEQRELLVKSQTEKAITVVNESTSRNKEALTTQKEHKERELRHFKEELGAQQEQELSELRDRIHALELKHYEIQAELKHVSPAPSAQEAVDKARKEKESYDHKILQINTEVLFLERSSDIAVRAFEQCEDKIKKVQVDIRAMELNIQKTLQAKEQEEKSLVGFLKKSAPDWLDHIGRVLPDRILLSTDLEPEFTDDAEQSTIYGLSLNLNKLTPTSLGNSNHFQNVLDTHQKQFCDLSQTLDSLKFELVTKRQAVDIAKKARDLLYAQESTTKNELQECEQRIKLANKALLDSKKQAQEEIEVKLSVSAKQLQAEQGQFHSLKSSHTQTRLREVYIYDAQIEQIAQERKSAQSGADASILRFRSELKTQLKLIDQERLSLLQADGVSEQVFSAIKARIDALDLQIQTADGLRKYVSEFRDWFDNQWKTYPQREGHYQKCAQEEKAFVDLIQHLKVEHEQELLEQTKALEMLNNQQNKLEALSSGIQKHYQSISVWPMNAAEKAAGLDPLYTIEALVAQKNQLFEALDRSKETIREGVAEMLKALTSYAGSGPNKYITQIKSSADCPRANKENEWLEVFRSWYGREQATHETSLRQMGETMAQTIDKFRRDLADFKQKVSNFNTELSKSLSQGKAFEGVGDLQVETRTRLEGKEYWEALQAFGQEYEQWHSVLETKLPPQSFAVSMKKIAELLSSDKNLTADPVDLIDFSIRATIDGHVKRASNEKEFLHIDSNGRTYIVLCLILIGFVNRIRQKEQSIIPFVVDELKTLSNANIEKLIKLLGENNLNIVCAFPNLDIDLAEHFSYNYRAQEGRRLAQIQIQDEELACV